MALSLSSLSYEFISGFASNCFTSPIIITYGLVIACYVLMLFLHPRQIPDFLYGLSYPITLPFMFLVLPVYCLFNMDDVSWGTREVKPTTENAEKKLEVKQKEKGPVSQWSFDVYDKRVENASVEVEHFWNKTIEVFLKPSKLKEEQEAVIKRDLKLMKIGAVIALGISNIGYSVIMILKMEITLPDWLTIGIKFCVSDHQVDYIDISLFVFVTVITSFLMIGTFLHRMETLSHIVMTTPVIKKKTSDVGEKSNQDKVINNSNGVIEHLENDDENQVTQL